MSLRNVATYFASPERSFRDEIDKQSLLFNASNVFRKIIDSVHSYVFVLNENRQIVFANTSSLELLNTGYKLNIYGLRVGEAINCIHSSELEAGCGTSEFCRNCGAVKAILTSLSGEEDVQECRITTKEGTEALDLRVWTKPLEINSQKFSVFTFEDISNEKRKLALERIFFHDVLNTLSALTSLAGLLEEATPEEKEEYNKQTKSLLNILAEEIKAHRDLSQAERNDLNINLGSCSSYLIVNKLTSLYTGRAEGKQIKISTEHPPEGIAFESDEVLVSRVLGNMIKNAIEACSAGDTITISSKKLPEMVRFRVNNPSYIPIPVQQQIFQRSFSTKGSGRGLGTYSMKLLTERYLKGKIYFSSDKNTGTDFFLELPAVYPAGV